jgi:hypothetical protein
MKKIGIILLIVLCSTQLVMAKSRSSSTVTKYKDVGPQIIYKNQYKRSNVLGNKTHKVPLYDDLRYFAFTSLNGITRIIFPENMYIKSRMSGMDDYFQITPGKDEIEKSGSKYRYLLIKPILPKNMPSEEKEALMKNPSVLYGTSTQLHVILVDENGKDHFLTFSLEISRKQHENESIEIVLEKEKIKDTDILNAQISKLHNKHFQSINRERLLNFGDFRIFEVNEQKTYNKETKVTLHTITATKGFYYYNITLEGNGLFPLKNEDIKLSTNFYSKGLFWEVKQGWNTIDVDSIIVYPNGETEEYPEQQLDVDPDFHFKHQVTLRFKESNIPDFFYAKLNIKNGSIFFENKVSFKSPTDTIYPFLNESNIWN